MGTRKFWMVVAVLCGVAVFGVVFLVTGCRGPVVPAVPAVSVPEGPGEARALPSPSPDCIWNCSCGSGLPTSRVKRFAPCLQEQAAYRSWCNGLCGKVVIQ